MYALKNTVAPILPFPRPRNHRSGIISGLSGVIILMTISALFLLFASSSAQNFVTISDRQWIELALDMVRKGVQQQDTTKVLTVMAQNVSIGGKASQSKADVARTLQGIFDHAHERKVDLQKPNFPRADNPLHLSNFWDFDILDPKITIDGDSAVVECKLVFWGSLPEEVSGQRGKRTKERFVFRTPPGKTMPCPPGAHNWPASKAGEESVSSRRNWRLVTLENLLNFLVASVRE
jgi:hypothetical protein